MPVEPEIRAMSYRSRSIFFYVLLVIFLISLPVFIFYTSGYRLDFGDEKTTIFTTGGMYITSDNLEVDVYLDTEQVQRPRLFRSAYYIQNIEVGIHKVVVQQPGLHTWVKQLPVDSYIVTEAAAFNMPILPHIRPIAPFVNANGQQTFFQESTSTDLFPKATTTEDFLVFSIPKRASTTLTASSEYEYVVSLFATTTATSSTIISRLEEGIERFKFATTTAAVPVATATVPLVYVEQGNMRLVERGDEIVATWVGSASSIPHYFCAVDTASSSIATRFGNHFAEQIEAQRTSTTSPLIFDNARVCRTEIRIDRKWQDILYYEFFPNSTDLVVLQLQDGLYVTEIDDRSWQNTQLVYPGDNFRAVVTDTNIYIEEDGRYFELLTRLEPVN